MPPKKQRDKEPEKGYKEHQNTANRNQRDSLHARKRKLYDDARKSIKTLVTSSINLLDNARQETLNMKAEESEGDRYTKQYVLLNTTQEDVYMHWRKHATKFLDQLGHERCATIDNASKMLHHSSRERKVALAEFSRNARAQVEQSRAKEKVRTLPRSHTNVCSVNQLVTDASEFIKYYKDFLKATK